MRTAQTYQAQEESTKTTESIVAMENYGSSVVNCLDDSAKH